MNYVNLLKGDALNGMTILSVSLPHEDRYKTKYRVHYHRCGHTDSVTGNVIRKQHKRREELQGLCAACSSRESLAGKREKAMLKRIGTFAAFDWASCGVEPLGEPDITAEDLRGVMVHVRFLRCMHEAELTYGALIKRSRTDYPSKFRGLCQSCVRKVIAAENRNEPVEEPYAQPDEDYVSPFAQEMWAVTLLGQISRGLGGGEERRYIRP